MSIAEFYIENGIDPSDPNHMDVFLTSLLRDDDYHYQDEPPVVLHSGLAVVMQEQLQRDFGSRSAASSWPLNESELDYMAETRGWEKIDGLPAQPPMASYRNEAGDIRLNFWLSTGTVGSYLEHPRQGKTQLFRRKIGMSMASSIFNDPRQHTGRGYHQKGRVHSASSNRKVPRKCNQCKQLKQTVEYSKNQRTKGAAARCRSCVGNS